MSPQPSTQGQPAAEGRMWGGRFAEAPDDELMAFSASLAYDRRLWPQDIRVSRVHAALLARAGLLGEDQRRRLDQALAQLAEDLRAGRATLDGSDEDVHSAVERLLVERVGELGWRLHAGRSRNDQVATDLRLWAREACDDLDAATARLQERLLERAEQEAETLMPGLTHLQPAQPVTLGHHLMAYVAMLFRDRDRIAQARRQANRLPLGAGALAGSGFPLDREWACRELGFEAPCANSMDAVSDRDFVCDLLYACSLLMVHLSRLAEEIILWNHPALGFVELPDRLATGSSMMPQKKNPDAAELIRARAGRVAGRLAGFLMVLKGLPLTYNRDLQEDKEALFEACDHTLAALGMAARLVEGLRFRRARMAEACTGELLATELADYLTTRGVPFREAHRVVGAVVAHAQAQGVPLDRLDLATLQRFSPLFGPDVLQWLDPRHALRRRALPGGTAPEAVREAIARARRQLAARAGGPACSAAGSLC